MAGQWYIWDVAGDYILKETVTEIRNKLIRDNDFFARSGGEEFCLLLLGGELSTWWWLLYLKTPSEKEFQKSETNFDESISFVWDAEAPKEFLKLFV